MACILFVSVLVSAGVLRFRLLKGKEIISTMNVYHHLSPINNDGEQGMASSFIVNLDAFEKSLQAKDTKVE